MRHTTYDTTPVEPVTTGGDYRMTDGTFHRFAWRRGRLRDDGPVPATLSAEEEARSAQQAAEAAALLA